MSRKHVRLLIEDGQARVTDLGSRNGTLVNGEKLDAEIVLLPGDRLQVGDSTVLFEPTARASLSDREADGELHTSPVEELIPAVGAVAGHNFTFWLGFRGTAIPGLSSVITSPECRMSSANPGAAPFEESPSPQI